LAANSSIRRVLVLGRNIQDIVPLVRERGLQVVTESPDLILTWGGDGLLLRSEAAYPGVPKLPLRNSRHGKKCQAHEVPEALDRLLEGRLSENEQIKVEAQAHGVVKVGLNDVAMHNLHPTSAVRFLVEIDGKNLGHELVGDGVVVATPFGSTGYFQSITRGSFEEGLGLAFNNSTEAVDHRILSEDSEIRLRITRGPAVLVADNQPDMVELDDGDEVFIRRHPATTVILRLS